MDEKAIVSAIGKEEGADIGGIHVEGPFISPNKIGAQNPLGRKDPSPEIFSQIIEEGKGYVRAMTCAPELPGIEKIAKMAAERSVVLLMGHTDATAICFYQWIGGRVKVIDYLEATMQALPYFVEQLRARNYKYDMVFFPHDGVNTEWAYGNTRIERMHELGFDCVTLPRILEQEQIDIARSMIPIVDIDRKLYRLIDCINNMRYDFKDGVMDTKHVVHDEYSHGAKAFMYMCQSIYKNRDEKREYTEQERREKMQQAMLDDIRRGLEANRRQLSDTEDLTKVVSRESY